MKKYLCAVLALAILLCGAVLTGCGGSEDNVDINALTEKMSAASSLPEMKTIRSGDERAERGFAAISSLDYDKVDAYCLMYAANGYAYELAVIKLKDEGDCAALQETLKAHIESRAQTFRTYDKEEVARAEGAVVAVHGRYVALIMGDDNAAVKAVFDAAFQ